MMGILKESIRRISMISYKNKKVLFITTKNLDYLRNTQEIGFIRNNGGIIEIIGSYSKSYAGRLLYVYAKILMTSMKGFDVVFIGFAPQLILALFGWKFKKNTVVIDFFISMYDTLVFDRKKIKARSLFAKILKHYDEKTIKAADEIVCDTNAHGQYFVEEFGADEEKLHTLYLEADKRIYYVRNLKRPNRLKDKYVVLYFGSILPLQGIEVILSAIDKIKNEKDFYFIIIGPIKENVTKPIADNIEYHIWLSQEELAQYIDYADLCLAGHFNKDINKAQRTIPGKAYIYDAMDKKIIFGDNPAVRELFSEDGDRYYFVEMGNPAALAGKILECAKKRDR